MSSYAILKMEQTADMKFYEYNHSQKEYKVGLPELPTQSEFNAYLSAIWSEKIVTNFGPIHNALEENLSKYLEVDNVVLFASGTSALEALLSMYNTSSRVVIPSFSFDATLTAVRRNNMQLGFVDVNVSDGTFETKSLRARPSAINSDLLLGVHCYGFRAMFPRCRNLIYQQFLMQRIQWARNLMENILLHMAMHQY